MRWRHSIRIAQCLRSYPVLTIRTVKIASQHAKTVGKGTRIGMKKRLLLDGIALHSTDIAPRHVEFAVAVEPDFANSELTLGNRAPVPAGKAANESPIHLLV